MQYHLRLFNTTSIHSVGNVTLMVCILCNEGYPKTYIDNGHVWFDKTIRVGTFIWSCQFFNTSTPSYTGLLYDVSSNIKNK